MAKKYTHEQFGKGFLMGYISVCCENCKHKTWRHSILCGSCLRFKHFEAKLPKKSKDRPTE